MTSRTLAFVVLVSLGTFATPSYAAHYDLKTDWSESGNPNGPWSYNQGSTLLPHQTNYPTGQGNLPAYAPSNGSVQPSAPFWFRAATDLPSANIDGQNITIDSKTGDIITQTRDIFNGNGMGLSNVTFTAPTSGVANLSGNVWNVFNTYRAGDWDLFLNGTLLSHGSVSSIDAFDEANPFNLANGTGGPGALQNIVIHTGDVFKMQLTSTSVFQGSTQFASGPQIGVNLTVDIVPEPASLALLGVGAAGLLMGRRRRKIG